MQNQFSVTGEISTLFGTTAADLTLNTRPKTQKKKKYVEPQYNNVKWKAQKHHIHTQLESWPLPYILIE